MKLINRRSAIMALTKQMLDGTDYRNEIVEQCIGAIRGLKVHDSNKRKTGKWVQDEYGTDHCSCCDYIPAYDTAIDDIYYSPYCPNCGAKMEVDNADSD